MSEPHSHLTRHFAALAPLGFNEMLFTHAGLSYSLTSSLYLDLAASGLTLHNKCRFITLNYNHEDNQTIVIRYLPYTTPIKLRTPVSLRSKAKVRSNVKIRKYDVTFNQNTYETQFRTTNYQDPDDFNLTPRTVANDSNYSVANNGDLISDLTITNPVEQVLREAYTLATESTPRQECIQRVLGKLPTERGYIYEVSQDLRDVDSPESFNNQRVSACKILLPSLTDGHIPASRVGHDMNNKSPADIAWALLYAIGAQRPIYVLNTLKGLVEEASRRGAIIKDSSEQYTVNPEATWGFEDKFKPGAPSYDSGRDIGDNALLGWAIVRAINYIQDRLPVEDWSLTGLYSDFEDKLLQLVLAQGYLCAYAISRQSWWCCERAEGFAYNYGLLSQRASYLTSLFLDELLQVTYNQFIHQQAARLYISLNSVQEGSIGSRYFTDFNDEENDSAAYRGFWLWAKEKQHQQAYDYLVSNYQDLANDTTDTLVTYSLTILHNKLEIEEALPAWVTAHRGDNQQAAMGVFLPVTKTARHYLPIYLTIYGIDITNENSFNLYALEAFAKVSFTLIELRRLWPRGYSWGSSQVINSINSVLGSLLQADANLYFDYFLLESLVVNAKSLSSCQGVYTKRWAEQLLKIDLSNLLVSDQRLRGLLLDYIQREVNDRESVVGLLRDTFGYTEASIEDELPRPYSLVNSFERWDETFTGYTAEVNQLDGSGYLNKEHANSIVYKPAQEQLVSEDITDCSAINRTTAYPGRALRRVAGFPYRNVPISFSYPNASLDVPINQEYDDLARVRRLMYPVGTELSNDKLNTSYSEWINEDLYEVDGTVLIKPLRDYIPKIVIKLGRVAGRYLGHFLQSTVAAGVKLKLIGSNHSRDYLNTFYVFAASSGKWRIDNINLFNNTDYDNDSA